MHILTSQPPRENDFNNSSSSVSSKSSIHNNADNESSNNNNHDRLRSSVTRLRTSLTNFRNNVVMTSSNSKPMRRLSAHASSAFQNFKFLRLPKDKPNILCLHGYRSNMEISALQLQHLGLDSKFHVHHLQGPIQTDDAADAAIQILSRGPYFSWMDSIDPDSDTTSNAFDTKNSNREQKEVEEEVKFQQLLSALKVILRHVDLLVNYESYDAVYGFSQGGTIASILSCPELVHKLRLHFQCRAPPQPRANPNANNGNGTVIASAFPSEEDVWYKRPCWKFAYLACAGNGAAMILRLKRYLLHSDNNKELDLLALEESHDFRHLSVSPLGSVHFIGINDPLKAFSEKYIDEVFRSERALPVYLNGAHEIPMFTQDKRKEVVLVECIGWFSRFKLDTSRYDSSHIVSMESDNMRSSSASFTLPPTPVALNMSLTLDINQNLWEDKGPLEVAHIVAMAKREVPFLSVYLEMRDFASRRTQLIESRRVSMDYNHDRKSSAKINNVRSSRRLNSMTHTPRKSSMGFYSTTTSRRMSLRAATDVEKQSEDIGILEPGLHGQYILNRIQPTYSSLLRVLQKSNPLSPALWQIKQSPNTQKPYLSYGDLCMFLEKDGDLRHVGCMTGDLIAYVSPPGIASAVAFVTITCQCTAAPLDPAYTQRDYKVALEQLNPRMLLIFDGVSTADDARRAAEECGTKIVRVIPKPNGTFSFDTSSNEHSKNTKRRRRLLTKADDIALILRTSGSTSKPKIVPLKMHAIISNARVIAKNLNLSSSDVALNAMPLFHIGGISSNLLSSLAAGASVIIMESFNVVTFVDIVLHQYSIPLQDESPSYHNDNNEKQSPDDSNALKESNIKLPKVTWYSAVPTIHAAICDCIEGDEHLSHHTLRFIRSGAAALPMDLAKRIEHIFQVPVVSTYSMTEQMPISQPPTGMSIISEKPGSVGRAIATSMCIVDANLRPIPKGTITAGEVCITGESVFESYAENPVATMQSFFLMGNMRWFRTGDMGYLDQDGFLFLTGRQKELIKRGGEQVSPYEVEDAITRYEKVKVCIVFSIPDELWGQRVGAAIVLQDKLMSGFIGDKRNSDINNESSHNNRNQSPQGRSITSFVKRFSVSSQRQSSVIDPLRNMLDEDQVDGNDDNKTNIIAEDSKSDDLSGYYRRSSSRKSSILHKVTSGVRNTISSINMSLHERGLSIFNKEIPMSKPSISEEELLKDLREYLIDVEELQHFKVPEKIVIVTEQDLPKTRSNKYIRTGLAQKLGIDKVDDYADDVMKDLKHAEINEACAGVRFALACAVVFGHVGDFGDWSHARDFCLHVPAFFFLGGFLLSAGTHVPVLDDLSNFFSLRLAVLHPMYILSIILLTINLVIRCQPSNYVETFDFNAKPIGNENFVCQSTIVSMPWGATLFTSLISNMLAIQNWPFIMPFSWFITNYGWFSSVYIFCVICFPWLHNYFYERRRDLSAIWRGLIFWFAMLYIYVGLINVTWPLGDRSINVQNYFGLSAYLFPPGWLPCFAIGVGSYYVFALTLPNEKYSAWKWGVLTDTLSVSFLACYLWYGFDKKTTTPDFVEDSKFETRAFAFFLSRAISPVSFIWLYGLAVGRGLTAKIFSHNLILSWLAPASYNVYLFHQLVAEWYYLATRGVWWNMPKSYYWFSGIALPVEWWEYIIVLGLTVLLSLALEFQVNSVLVEFCTLFVQRVVGSNEGLDYNLSKSGENDSPLEVISSIIRAVTGANVKPENSLTECGLSSMTTLVLVAKIKQHYKILMITARDIVRLKTVGELVEFVSSRLKRTAVHGGFEIGTNDNVINENSNNNKSSKIKNNDQKGENTDSFGPMQQKPRRNAFIME